MKTVAKIVQAERQADDFLAPQLLEILEILEAPMKRGVQAFLFVDVNDLTGREANAFVSKIDGVLPARSYSGPILKHGPRQAVVIIALSSVKTKEEAEAYGREMAEDSGVEIHVAFFTEK